MTTDITGGATACRASVETFLGRDLEHWTGLATGCSEQALTGWLSFRDGEGVAQVGTLPAEYRFRVLPHPGFREGVEFFFRGRELSFVATDYWSFDRGECDGLLRSLGQPERQLTFHWRDSSVDGGEWLYASRGLSVGVLPDTGLVARLIGFPPCEPDLYIQRYYNTRPAREFRLRANRE